MNDTCAPQAVLADGFQTVLTARNNILTVDSLFVKVPRQQLLAHHLADAKECAVVALAKHAHPTTPIANSTLALYCELVAVPVQTTSARVPPSRPFEVHLKVWTTHQALPIEHEAMPQMVLEHSFTSRFEALCAGVDMLETCARMLCGDAAADNTSQRGDVARLFDQLRRCNAQILEAQTSVAFRSVPFLSVNDQTGPICRHGVFALANGSYLLRLPPTSSTNGCTIWECQYSRQDAVLLYNAMLQMHPDHVRLTREFAYTQVEEGGCTTHADGKTTACRLCGVLFPQTPDKEEMRGGFLSDDVHSSTKEETGLLSADMLADMLAEIATPPASPKTSCRLSSGALPPQKTHAACHSIGDDVVRCVTAGCATALHKSCAGLDDNTPSCRWTCETCTRQKEKQATPVQPGCAVQFVFAGRSFALKIQDVCTETQTFTSDECHKPASQLLAQILARDALTPVTLAFGTGRSYDTILTARPL